MSEKIDQARIRKIKLIKQLVKLGCSDHTIALKFKCTDMAIGSFRRRWGIKPSQEHNHA